MEKFFKLRENSTDVRTEVLAGFTTFFAMAYIIMVNPDILEASGMPWGQYSLQPLFQQPLVPFLWVWWPMFLMPWHQVWG